MGVEVYHNLKVCPFSLLEGDGLYLRLVVKFCHGEVFSWVFEPHGLRMITLVFILSRSYSSKFFDNVKWVALSALSWCAKIC